MTDAAMIARVKGFNSISNTADFPCNGCQYRKHCSGENDHVTGARGVSADSCAMYDDYRLKKLVTVNHSQVPHRVNGVLALWNKTGS